MVSTLAVYGLDLRVDWRRAGLTLLHGLFAFVVSIAIRWPRRLRLDPRPIPPGAACPPDAGGGGVAT